MIASGKHWPDLRDSTSSRRRKTKCDGARPRCRHCTKRDIPCTWPWATEEEILSPPVVAESTAIGSPLVDESVPDTNIQHSRQGAQIVLPTLESLRRIFDLFFERHFVVDFCSFEYLPTWESHYSEKPFLVASIIVLCAQYLTPEESWRAFGLKTGHDVRSHYLPVAESMARDTLTTPTGWSTLPQTKN